MPATEKMYEGLDLKTGSTDINIGNKGTEIAMESAKGTFSYPKPTSNGSFKSNRGVSIKSMPPDWQTDRKNPVIHSVLDNDLAVSGIVSPKTTQPRNTSSI